MPEQDETAIDREPDEYQTHTKTFEVGCGFGDIGGMQNVVTKNMERLANRVGRPCKVVVSIQVYDVSGLDECDLNE